MPSTRSGVKHGSSEPISGAKPKRGKKTATKPTDKEDKSKAKDHIENGDQMESKIETENKQTENKNEKKPRGRKPKTEVSDESGDNPKEKNSNEQPEKEEPKKRGKKKLVKKEEDEMIEVNKDGEPKEEDVEVPEVKKKKEKKVTEGSKGKKKNEIENEVNADTSFSIYEFTANDIKGNPISLSKYKGHVCIIVNVASRCGHTKSNYEQFVKLHEDYAESKGLRILAFPCNQFGKQEPGDSEKICKFASERNVKFDMFEKINVNGSDAHPLYKYLTAKIKGPNGNAIKWNFTKFIIDKNGLPVERFTPSTKPLALVETLEKYW